MDPLKRILYQFSPYDPFYVFQTVEGTLLTGSPGAGKSSTALKQLSIAFLNAGFGGFFISSKPEDTRTYTRYVKATGREKDLITFGPGSGAFDVLHYLWNRPGRGAAMLETVVDTFSLLMSVASPSRGPSHEPFWEQKAEQLMRAAIVILHLAGEPISIFHIDKMIQSFPKALGENEKPEWQQDYCGQAFLKIRDRKEALTPARYDDFSRAITFICVEWPGLDERPRSSVLATFTGLADKFLYQPFLSVLASGKCTWLPEEALQAQKVVIIDYPSLDGGDTFRIATCLIKLAIQDALAHHDVETHPTPSFLIVDEAQLYILPKGRDERFQQICRSARVCCLYATQNLLQLASEFGEHDLGPRTKGWLANIGTRIAMQQHDPDTNQATADLIGKVYKPISGSSVSEEHASFSSNMHLEHRVLPSDFNALPKANPFRDNAGAIVYCGSYRFPSTVTEDNPAGEPFLLTTFTRN